VKSPAPVYLKTLSAEWSFPMKKLLLSVFMLNLCLAPLTFAGEKAITTGDAHLDGDLQYLNEAAQKNLKGFCNDLSYHYDAEAGVVERLINIAGMAPADVYMAAKVRILSHRSWDEVLREYKENNGKGWGVIAKNLGIKPGSREFHELKDDDSGMIALAKGKKGKVPKEKGNKSKDKDKNKGKKEKKK
jgi:hypothetical protein